MFVEQKDGIPALIEKEAITEHFFTCKPTSEIRRNWNVREEDLKSKETFTLTKESW